MSNLAEATTKIVDVLSGFSSDERIRIVRASLMLLGDELIQPTKNGKAGADEVDQNNDNGGDSHQGIPPLARQWLKKHSVTEEHLEHYFHFDQGKSIPIALPGAAKTKREQSINAYLTVGLSAYLATGDASFSDADARKFCEQSGCYDGPNHAKSIKAFGNKITGSKSTGWKLTAPGLAAVAELIKAPKN